MASETTTGEAPRGMLDSAEQMACGGNRYPDIMFPAPRSILPRRTTGMSIIYRGQALHITEHFKASKMTTGEALRGNLGSAEQMTRGGNQYPDIMPPAHISVLLRRTTDISNHRTHYGNKW